MNEQIFYSRPAILATLNPATHIAIEAHAGTGKTYTIEHMVIDLLLHKTAPLRIEEILVLTFTDKAATELRTRIRGIIETILHCQKSSSDTHSSWTIGKTERDQLRQALFSFDLAQISTIHGFCTKILKENAFFGNQLFEMEITNAYSIFQRALVQLLRTTFATEARCQLFLELWLKQSSLTTLADQLWKLYKNGRLLDGSEWWAKLDEQAIKLQLPLLGQHVANLVRLKELKEKAPTGKKKLHDSINGNTLNALLKRVQNIQQITADHFEPFPYQNWDTLLENLQEALDSLDKIFANEKHNYDPESTAILQNAQETITTFLHRLPTLAEMILQIFHTQIIIEMEHLKRGEGLLDFDDLLRLVNKSLQNGEAGKALIATLRARFKMAIVDEFQDTDNTQWKIFREIFLNSPETSHGPTNRICIVGDPKQSIYGFRSADVNTYLAARDTVCKFAKLPGPTQLIHNYRSSPEMISAYNLIFSSPSFFTNPTINYADPVECGGSERQKAIFPFANEPAITLMKISPAPTANGKALSVKRLQECLALWMAETIKELLTKEPPPTESKDEVKPLNASSIYVLTRTGSEGLLIAEQLRAKGVRCAMTRSGNLFTSAAAREVRQVLEAICAPTDRTKVMLAALTRFFDLTIAELYECEKGRHPKLMRLDRWVERAVELRGSIAEFLEELFEESTVFDREIFWAENERDLTDFIHIFEILIEKSAREPVQLIDLAKWLRTLEEESQGSEERQQRLETDQEAVQIMTMHSCKGLEARVVFLFGGFSVPECKAELCSIPFDENGAVRRFTFATKAPSGWLERLRSEQRHENERLLYVALTRAKEKMYLPLVDADPSQEDYFLYRNESDRRKNGGRVSNKYSKDGPHLHLNQVLQTLCSLHQNEPAFDRLFTCKERNEESFIQLANESPDASSDHQLAQCLASMSSLETIAETKKLHSQVETLRSFAHPLAVSSYSSLKSSIAFHHEIIAPGSDEEAPASHHLDDATLPAGASFGICVHAILEAVFANLSLKELFQKANSADDLVENAEMRGLIEREMTQAGFGGLQTNYVAKLAFNALRTPLLFPNLTLPGGLSSLTRHRQELEFLLSVQHSQITLAELSDERLKLREGYLKGFIDLLFEHDGRIWFVDWKTDRLDNYAPAALQSALQERGYTLQDHIYTTVVVRMLGLQTEEEYNRRVGGRLFCFVRGMQGADATPQEPNSNSVCEGVASGKLSWNSLQQLLAISGDLSS